MTTKGKMVVGHPTGGNMADWKAILGSAWRQSGILASLVIGVFGVTIGLAALLPMWSATDDFADYQVDVETSAEGTTATAAEVEESAAELSAAATAVADEEVVSDDEAQDLVESIDATADAVEELLAEVPAERPQPVVDFVLFEWITSADSLFIGLMVAAGVLGAGLSLIITTLYDGETRTVRGPVRAFARLVGGGGLAAVAFFGIRGGLLNLNVDSSNLNPYAVVFLAALIGIFVKRTFDRLAQLISPETAAVPPQSATQ